jgi:hypothetical protein
MDPKGKLYLNFRYFPNDLSEDEAGRLGIAGNARKDCAQSRCWYNSAPELEPRTLVSDDNGANWH